MSAHEDILLIAIQQLADSNQIAIALLQKHCDSLTISDLVCFKRSVELMGQCKESLEEFQITSIRREALVLTKQLN